MDVNLDNAQNTQPQEQQIERKRRIMTKTETSGVRQSGSGIDIGTGFLVSAISIDGNTKYKTQRDAFIDVENNVMSKNMLSKLNAPYIESEDKKQLFVIGDEALHIGSFLNRECRRPLAKGVLSSREKECLMMLKLIIHSLVGDPIVPNEKIFFSVPANPIDDNFNGIYHENVIKSFLISFGFAAESVNEAFAIIMSELEDENYSGIALSFGSGMVNCALSFMGISDKKHQFSISRAGDWIDENAAIALGMKTSRITMIKETGVDLLAPKNREENAVKIFYENLINYTCNAMEKNFTTMQDIPNFAEPITVVISGGTSKAINFDNLFEQELRTKTLPFQIKAVRKASDPLNAVAKGCLLNALAVS